MVITCVKTEKQITETRPHFNGRVSYSKNTVVFNVAGPQALITVLINMILLGAGTLMLYVFAMSLAVLIIVEK